MLVPTRIDQAKHRAAARLDGSGIVIYCDGARCAAFRRDAEVCQRYAFAEIAYEDQSICAFEAALLERTIRRLVAAGYRVAVLEPVPDRQDRD